MQKGREFLTCKKVGSYHKRDVTCVDVTLKKNNMVTASTDNMICFWNTFSATITKKI
jgi:WD40 repeat protein